ncbi:MAG: intein-containing adenosylcobalamin-dependent ribonucleoside-diphosphate reductase, partial [Patescibacteria group bacterium]|nr:intein-containing adenosylcobalamin-dependent ribonucleoside-diphosphate reductase [Patescibacteria group bacterium]
MRGYDAFAGVIKSGGKTRRAAKMVILNVDHPDIEEFITCKQREERKARSLVEAGYDASIDGEAYSSIFFQNANNSVRVTDDFMRAVVDDGEWQTKAVVTGATVETMRARDLMKKISEATWECGDPGLQFDTTVNRWNPTPVSGRINGSNPCVTGDTLVATAKGWKRIDSLLGLPFQVMGSDDNLHQVHPAFPTGIKPVYRLTTESGFNLKLTADHKVLTKNRGDVPAIELTPNDSIVLGTVGFGDRNINNDFAEFIGKSIAKGEIAHDSQREWLSVDSEGKIVALADIVDDLDHEEQRSILFGWIKGAAKYDGYPCVLCEVPSEELRTQLHLLLLNIGIKTKNKDGYIVFDYEAVCQIYLEEDREQRLFKGILTDKQWADFLNEGCSKLADKQRFPMTDKFVSLELLGDEPVYDLTEPDTSHFVAGGLVVHNCSEYMFLDDSSCNLASLNLMKFRRADGEFDVAAFKHAVEIIITAQEIVVGAASYPTPAIEQNSHDFRPLGIGYANLGAMLMARGLAYDSDEGRNYAAAVTALMTGHAYHQSARLAEAMGPFTYYRLNEKPFLKVVGMHRDYAYAIPDAGVPDEMLVEARHVWDAALENGMDHGYRNAQMSVLAPTGTIGFLMDCDTTGIEPDIALVKYKWLVGGGLMKIVNSTVPEALDRLGYSEEERAAILKHIDENDTIEGAPFLKEEHLSVFDCAFKPAKGTRFINYMGHIRMMSAVQPFLSGAISKTVNLPKEASVEDIERTYVEAWKSGLKAVAVYRDGSKGQQVLTLTKDKKKELAEAAPAPLPEVRIEYRPLRRRLPYERKSLTHKFSIAGHDGFITVGLYDDGTPGEIFLRMSKGGSVVSGLMDSFAVSTSIALQYGVPLKVLVNKFAHVRFEPSGFTSNPNIRIAKSIMDYIFRWMASRFLSPEEQAAVGVSVNTETVEDAVKTDIDASSKIATDAAVDAASSAAPGVAEEGARQLNLTDSPTRLSGSAALSASFDNMADAPPCETCGTIMVRNGACYKCLNCGSTSGCS